MSNYIDCSIIGEPCCNYCIYDEWDGFFYDMSSKSIETKHGTIDFLYCCRHSFYGKEEELKKILETKLESCEK